MWRDAARTSRPGGPLVSEEPRNGGRGGELTGWGLGGEEGGQGEEAAVPNNQAS